MRNILFGLIFLTSLTDIEKISEALGHLIGKHIEQLELPIDLAALAKGIEEETEGKNSPLSEEDCLEAIATLQKKKTDEIAEKNTKEAERFLASNQNCKTVTSLIDGKLQYEIITAGDGQKVEPYNSPIVRITGYYLDGQPFNIPLEDELLTLEESIPAFREGLVGMREGEVRKLYVHPELGYGDESYLRPSALLIFEVEVIRADAAADEEIAQDSFVETSLQ